MCRKGRSTFISLTAVECVRWTHGIKIERNNLLCEQAPTEVFRSIFAWLVTLNLLCDFVQCHIIQCSPTVHIAFVSHTDGQGSVSYLDLRNGGVLPVRLSSKLEGSSQLLAVYQRIQIHVSIIGQISALRERG